jgi:hypothetical protein
MSHFKIVLSLVLSCLAGISAPWEHCLHARKLGYLVRRDRIELIYFLLENKVNQYEAALYFVSSWLLAVKYCVKFSKKLSFYHANVSKLSW